MPLDPTISLGVKVPDPMNTLGGIMDIAGKAQQIKAVGIQNQANQANLQERNNLRQLFQNPQDMLGDDGNIDFNKAGPKIMEAAPTQGGAILSNLITSQNQSIAAKKSINELNDQQRTSIGQWLISNANDPELSMDKVKSGLEGQVKMNPNLSPAAQFAWQHYVLPTGGDPAKLKEAMLRIGQSVMPVTAQVEAMTPGGPMVTNQAQTGMLNNKPLAGPVGIVPGSVINNQIPLDARQTVSTNAITGMPMTTTKDAFGNVQGVSMTPTAGTVPQLQPGDREAISGLSGERESARTQLNSAPLLHETNRGILREIDQVSATGTSGPVFQKINSILGGTLDFSDKEKAASSYDLVGKYLERNALQAAASMGPQTNAGLDAQIKANGSIAYNPTAIKQITKLNDALVSGTEAYQPGLEKAISTNPQQGVLAKRQFDQQWAQNFDPRIMMIYNASKAGDKEEVDKIINQMGGKNSIVAKDLMRKAQNLHQLSQNGHL